MANLLLVNIGLSAHLHESLLLQDPWATFEVKPLTNLVEDVGRFDPLGVRLRVLSAVNASCTQALVPLGSDVRLVRPPSRPLLADLLPRVTGM